jgi:hypothetical protein
MSTPSKPKVEMQQVKSSQISHVGYDEPARELHVRFNSGGTYVYSDVAPQTHFDFMLEGRREGGSMGSFLHKRVKGVHEYRKMEEDDDGK